MAKGYPDYYRPILLERGISDVRGISPLGYTQFKMYYGYVDGAILAEKPFHAKYAYLYTIAPPEADVWYDLLTDEIFGITARMDMVLLGLYTHNCTIEAYVEAAGQMMIIEPYFWLRVNKVNKFKTICYRLIWDETTPTIKRSAGKYEVADPIYIYEGDLIDIRFGFRYMTTVAGSVLRMHLNFDLLKEDAFIQLPIKAVKAIE